MAILSSNCPIEVQREKSRIIMKTSEETVSVLIPERPGMREFVYRWGRQTARFDDERVEVSAVRSG